MPEKGPNPRFWSAFGRQALPYLLAVIAAFAAVGVFIALMGFDVLQAYQTILFTSFKTPNGLVQTLVKFVPIMLMSFAFTIPMSASKFNIGGDGQLIIGAVGAFAAGFIFKDLPGFILLPLVILSGALFGAIWGFIAGWLLYKFNVSEILTTVLLNFISYQVIDVVATSSWRDPAAGHPTTLPIGEGGFLPMLVANPPLHSGLILGLVLAVAVYFYTNHTTAGYDLVATGANPRSARVFGINVRTTFAISLVLGGIMAGLAGAIEVAGVQHRLIVGLQSNFLILGLAIGLISKGNNLMVPFVAFFIAVLEVGASALQRFMNIPVEMVLIVEALVLLFVLLADVVRKK